MRIEGDQTLTTTARDWDLLAARRDLQVRAGKDLSFTYVISPALFRLCRGCNWSRVLDAGCGTGPLTERLAMKAEQIIGIDVSPRSIALARSHSKLHYEVTSIQGFARRNVAQFTLVVASMVLMNSPSLNGTVRAIARLLRRGGHLVFAITHPWFWPTYWGYASSSWFDYNQTTAISADFRISLDDGGRHRSTHFHRPFENYVTALTRAGFAIEAIREPMPSVRIRRKYPKAWREPRFLLARCRKL